MEGPNISAESAIHQPTKLQKLDESRFQRLLMGQSNSWGDAPRLKVNCDPGAKQIQRGALRVQDKAGTASAVYLCCPQNR
jgi:hypothetical protein